MEENNVQTVETEEKIAEDIKTEENKPEETTSKSTSVDKKKRNIIIAAIVAVLAVVLAVIWISGADSREVKKQLQLGQKYLTDMNYEEAIACFEKALGIDPMCVEAYEGEVDAYMAMGEYEKAKEVAERGVQTLTSGGASSDTIALLQAKSDGAKAEIDRIAAEEAARKAEEEARIAEEEARKAEEERQKIEAEINGYIDSANKVMNDENATPEQIEETIDILKKAADLGSVESLDLLYTIGSAYYSGVVVEQSYDKAFEIFDYCAKRNHMSAATDCANMALDPEYPNKTVEDSVEYIEILYSLDDSGNEYYSNAGNSYQEIFSDYEGAILLYNKGIERNEATSYYLLARMYEDGIGVETDYAKAKDLYERGIANTSDEGGTFHNNLGYMYGEALGVDEDLDKAIELYDEAIALGNETAVRNKAVIYAMKGERLYNENEDIDGAIRNFEIAVELWPDVPHGQENLEYLYSIKG